MNYVFTGQPPDHLADLADDVLARQAVTQREAFAALYHRHIRSVYRYILARSGYVPDAQDITAATFIAAFKGIETYRGDGRFLAWLLGIARGQIAMYYRRQKTTLPLEEAEQVAHPGAPPESVVEDRLRIEAVAEALKTLNPDRAEAVALRLFAGLETDEIAQAMGRSEGAVRVLVHRGVQDLRKQLGRKSDNDY
jgi:RNA polymerase sigma-70 factor (ECF subfamily)